MWRRGWIAILCLAALSGCGHNLYLVGRSTGKTGHARVVAAGTSGGDITIDLGGKRYTGQWVFVRSGGSIDIGSATAFSGTHSATGFANVAALPTQGNGSIIAAADDGTRLRCIFDYNAFGQTGLGVCQDTQGEIYDLQIN
jgi:hypothetical protein